MFMCFVNRSSVINLDLFWKQVFSYKFDSTVKRVSWFKSSLLLKIQIKYTQELQFLIKAQDSIFNRKLYTTDERSKPSVVGLGF